jgi:hypothetical protein
MVQKCIAKEKSIRAKLRKIGLWPGHIVDMKNSVCGILRKKQSIDPSFVDEEIRSYVYIVE